MVGFSRDDSAANSPPLTAARPPGRAGARRPQPRQKPSTKVAAKVKGKVVHPNSRKAKRAHHSFVRKDRMIEQQKAANSAVYKKAKKLQWFREQITDPLKRTYTQDEICSMIEAYIERDMQERQGLQSGKLRGSAQREMMLKVTHEQELALYNGGAGFEAPDLTEQHNVQRFLNWEGELTKVISITMACFRKPRPAVDTVGQAMEL